MGYCQLLAIGYAMLLEVLGSSDVNGTKVLVLVDIRVSTEIGRGVRPKSED